MPSHSFSATLDHLHEMLEYVHTYGLSLDLSDEMIDPILLAVEEALVNVMHYAYPKDKRGKIKIDCNVSFPRHGMVITLVDQGIPFDPIKHLPIHLPAPSAAMAGETSLGGYGIWILIKLMDRVEYTRHHGDNVLTLTKYTG